MLTITSAIHPDAKRVEFATRSPGWAIVERHLRSAFPTATRQSKQSTLEKEGVYYA